MTDESRREAGIVAVILAGPSVGARDRSSGGQALESAVGADAGVVISTCQRVEAYVEAAAAADLRSIAEDHPGSRVLHGRDAARHAIALAVGLESAVLAEDQVLHQVRRAVATARDRGIGRDLEAVFETALRAGRTARSWRQGQPRSLAHVAVDQVLAAAESSGGTGRLLVVGSGEMGRAAARAAADRGVPVAIASRHLAHARGAARVTGAEAWPLDPGPRVDGVRGVVAALSGPWVLEDRTIDRLAGVPLVADLSLPSAVPESLAALLGPRLRDVDAIAAIGAVEPPSRADAAFRARLVGLVDRLLELLDERLARRDSADLAGVLAQRAEQERARQLDALWRRLPDLAADERDAIESMTRHLARRLLREPFERLGRDADGDGRRAARELFGL